MYSMQRQFQSWRRCRSSTLFTRIVIPQPAPTPVHFVNAYFFCYSHQDCIMPWLKINGSCPVCRYTLNGQSQNTNNDTPGSPPNTDPSSQSSHRPAMGQQQPGSGGPGGGLLSSISNLLGSFGAVNRGSTSGTTGNQSAGESGSYQHQPQQRRGGRSDSLPPEEDLD